MLDPAFTQTMQIGIVVRDLASAMRKFIDEFGVGPWQTYEFHRHELSNTASQFSDPGTWPSL